MAGLRLLLGGALLIALGISPKSAEAQTYRYELGVSLLSNYYLGDLGRQGLFAPQRPGIAIDLRRNVGLRWTLTSQLALRGLHGDARYASTTFPGGVTTESFSRLITDLSAGAEFHFFPYSEGERYLGTRSWTPYLGAGLTLGAGQSAGTLQLIPSLYVSLGAKLRLSSRWALHAGWTLRRTATDALEGLSPATRQLTNPYQLSATARWKGADSYSSWAIGISYSLSRRELYPCK